MVFAIPSNTETLAIGSDTFWATQNGLRTFPSEEQFLENGKFQVISFVGFERKQQSFGTVVAPADFLNVRFRHVAFGPVDRAEFWHVFSAVLGIGSP